MIEGDRDRGRCGRRVGAGVDAQETKTLVISSGACRRHWSTATDGALLATAGSGVAGADLSSGGGTGLVWTMTIGLGLGGVYLA